MPDLVAQLDAPLPAALAAGGATALFVCGWAVSPQGRIAQLELLVDGEPQPLAATRMPRLDVYRALRGSDDDPSGESYRSGFWGLAQVSAAPLTIALRARLEGGGEAVAELAAIAAEEPPQPVAAQAGVAICMATYDPPQELLERQLESIRAQTHRDWVCVISDDCSSPERFAALQAAVAGDERFVVSRSPARLGFYRNFERALALAPATARHIALADQDDRWDADKLETLLGAIGDAQLVYSDARVVDRAGAPIADSYWHDRANNHSDLRSLLVANAVTGAASLLRADLLRTALPFPPGQFGHYHDHWLALCALARGDIAYVDRPLYDYVQHGDASLGHAAATSMPGLRERIAGLANDPRERVRMRRLHYFVDVWRMRALATILQLRCGASMAPGKRRALERFHGAERSPAAIATLAAQGVRDIASRRPQTLGAEWTVAQALIWRKLLGATTTERPQRRLRLDAVPPPDLAPKPARASLEGTPARALADKIAPLELAVRDDAPRRVNVLIPTIDLQHFFGGYIGKLNLARRLAETGDRVRLVTVDPTPPLPRDWRERIAGFSGLEGVFDRVEVAFGRETPGGVEISPDDRFVATTWWTAHVAHAALRHVRAERFLYLIQEYEPFTFPMGSYAALARASYDFPHDALFSTELLREWFLLQEIGDGASVSFQNAITAVAPPHAEALAARAPRSLLFYARPEPHAARNLFELGVLALQRALADGAFAGWRLQGIGSVDGARRIGLAPGAALTLLPRSAQGDYAALLREHDVGLALMHTPHPSLVPIEMASAGMLTVTSTYENKTADELAAISPNLIACEPSVEAIADGLRRAAAQAGDVEARVAGARAVEWSRDWDRSFDDELLARVRGWGWAAPR